MDEEHDDGRQAAHDRVVLEPRVDRAPQLLGQRVLAVAGASSSSWSRGLLAPSSSITTVTSGAGRGGEAGAAGAGRLLADQLQEVTLQDGHRHRRVAGAARQVVRDGHGQGAEDGEQPLIENRE